MNSYDSDAFRMGIEFEYQITDLTGKSLHWQDLSFSNLKGVIARSAAPSNSYMAVKYPGSSQRSFYLEGYDLTDQRGRITDLHVKGIEISTPIASSVHEQQQYLISHYAEMQSLLFELGLRGSIYGAHLNPDEYRGPRGERTVEGWASAETAMMTWGIHVNVSFPDSVERELANDALYGKFDLYAPALVLLSANTPARGGTPWTIDGTIGKSERSWRRSFTRRPLYFRDDQRFRKEVTCFDVTNRLDLIRGYTAVVSGLMLENNDFDPVTGPTADHNMRLASIYGYDAPMIDRHFQRLDATTLVRSALDRAAKGLADHGIDSTPLAPLYELVDSRRCPADDTLSVFYAAKDWSSFLTSHSELTDG